MTFATIHKGPEDWRVPPNLRWDTDRELFTWDAARGWLNYLPQGEGLNIAHEAVDRHAAGPRATQVAIRWLGTKGPCWSTPP